MTTRATSRPRCSTAILVWIVAAIILALYFSGVVAYSVITNWPQLTIYAVMRNVVSVDFFEHVSMLHFTLVLTVAFGAIALYTLSRSLRTRLIVLVACIILPLCFLGPVGLFAVPMAPLFSLTALLGAEDGEFYAEGWLTFVAVGWWIILWCVMFYRELRIWVDEPFAPNQRSDCNEPP